MPVNRTVGLPALAAAPAPTEEQIARFTALLEAEGLAVRRRVPRGRSIMAGCGQLGGQ